MVFVEMIVDEMGDIEMVVDETEVDGFVMKW
jgi:hypothetical protein